MEFLPTRSGKGNLLRLFIVSIMLSQPCSIAANQAWDDATRLYTAGDFAGALVGFRKIADKMPTDPSTHYMLGQCYKGVNKPQQAILEYTWLSKLSDPRFKAMGLGALKQMQPASSLPVAGAARGPREFINDSASQTVTAAYKDGWVPCRAGCLTFAKSGWHHVDYSGHPASDQWMDFHFRENDADRIQSYNQYHVGHIIKESGSSPATDAGACTTCNGTGWVRFH